MICAILANQNESINQILLIFAFVLFCW